MAKSQGKQFLSSPLHIGFKNSISRDGDKGRIWTKFWNEQMDECQGFDDLTPNNVDGSKDEPSYKLSCMPSTVVYGHMASRGLEINRWTKGLDSGCVYGHKLNALVLTRPSHKVILPAIDEDSEHDSDIKHIPFGDESSGLDARIVSVKCKVSS